MKHIDETQLATDLEYRFNYLVEFIGLTAEDIEVIHGAAGLLAPLVDGLVDAVYDKLYTYDATWQYFVPRQSENDDTDADSVEAVDMDHEHIQHRKQHLALYLKRLVTKPYDVSMVKYLDNVGKIHTAKLGNPDINIPLVHINALFGFVADAINATILGADLPDDARAAAIRAFSKLLWIQNDLMNRHYID